MIVTWEDKDYEYDENDLDLRQAIYIQDHFGLTPATFASSFRAAEPKGLLATYWLLMKQNGITVDPNKVNFKIMDFWNVVIQAMIAESEAMDPTDDPESQPAPGTSDE